MKKIDLSTYKRIDHFNYFKNMQYPYVGCTVCVDVTDMVGICKDKELSFYLGFIHVVARVADSIQEFRQRIVEDGVVEYEFCLTSHTEPLEDGTYAYCTLYHQFDTLQEYYADALARRKKAIETPSIEEENDVDSMYFVSTLPWVHYTGLVQPVDTREAANPRFTWGKYEKDGTGKMMMPLTVLAHHGLVDGRQIGEFYARIDQEIRRFVAEASMV